MVFEVLKKSFDVLKNSLKNLKILREKEYKLHLILLIWLIIAITLLQFSVLLPPIYGVIFGWAVFFPLVLTSIIIIGYTKVIKKIIKRDGEKISKVKLIIMLIIFFIFLGAIIVISFWAIIFIFFLGVASYIFFTSLFTMETAYRKGVQWDEKFFKWRKPISTITRLGLFWGFCVAAILLFGLLILASGVGALIAFGIGSDLARGVTMGFMVIGWVLILEVFAIAFIGLLFIFIGRLNAWIGFFAFWVAIYSWFLFFKAIIGLVSGGGGGGTVILPLVIGLYLFDLILMLTTINEFVGPRGQKWGKRFHMDPDTIILWLIFSKAAFEFLNVLSLDVTTSLIKTFFGFIFFIPLMFLAGLWGILRYGKTKKARKTRIKRERLEKKEAKEDKRETEDEIKPAKEEMEPAKEEKETTIEEIEAIKEVDTEPVKKEYSPQPNKVFCSQCGVANDEDVEFCEKCGSELIKPKD